MLPDDTRGQGSFSRGVQAAYVTVRTEVPAHSEVIVCACNGV